MSLDAEKDSKSRETADPCCMQILEVAAVKVMKFVLHSFEFFGAVEHSQ
jgi:hypothetical protein